MSIDGGATTRRTWEGGSYGPVAWTGPTGWLPDGRLLHATTAYATLPDAQVVALDLESGAVEPIPLAEASEAVVEADGTTLFFVHPAFQGNVTKRYTGGTARDVWSFELDGSGQEAVELTGDWVGESHSPMPWEGRVYFVSDRDGTMNLWSMTQTGEDLIQHTRHSALDVRQPTLSRGVIVYNVGADLWRWDVGSTAAPRRIPNHRAERAPGA
jgi:tricorn protease